MVTEIKYIKTYFISASCQTGCTKLTKPQIKMSKNINIKK